MIQGALEKKMSAYRVEMLLCVWVCAGGLVGGCLDETESVDSSVCLSGTRWIGGNEESPHMNPGQDCIGCHASSGEGPSFSVAGSVYGRAGEANNCFGAKGATVQITDSAGKVITLTSNDAGNFYTSEGFTPPYTAKVIFEGQERAMIAAQMSGACNSCHSAAGANNAPGRVLLPGVAF
jgi:hypothetical protein